MPKFKVYTAKEMVDLLEENGFVLARQKGSHQIFKKDGNKLIIGPVHDGKDLKIGLSNRILKDANISI